MVKPARSDQNPTFESALVELENIVARMEGGQLSLEHSLTAYKRAAPSC
jgi:exodeoxyribonuclease VII small subunit